MFEQAVLVDIGGRHSALNRDFAWQQTAARPQHANRAFSTSNGFVEFFPFARDDLSFRQSSSGGWNGFERASRNSDRVQGTETN